MDIQNTPVLGGPAPRHAVRTANKLGGFALRFVDAIQGQNGERQYLDVGCGNGFITEIVAPRFDTVVGIDVETQRLEDFRKHTGETTNYKILEMSAAQIDFPDEHFSFITSFEVLEHVVDLEASVNEIVRVCKKGGVLVISVPQVWFAIENHGARFGNKVYIGKVPLLPYIRPLHKKYSLARVFSSGEMDQIFVSKGMELLGTGYATPQFERAAVRKNSWEKKLSFLKDVLDRCETIPVVRALTGVSLLKAYRKTGMVH